MMATTGGHIRVRFPRWRFVVGRVLMEPVACAYSLGLIREEAVDIASQKLARWIVRPAKIVKD